MAGGSPKKRPAIVTDILEGPLEDVPVARLELYRSKPLSDLQSMLHNQTITWRGFQSNKSKLEEQLKCIAVEIRWQLEEKKQAKGPQESCPDIAAGVAALPAPQGAGPLPQPERRMVPQVQGNTHGSRQLRQLQGVQRRQLPVQSVMAVGGPARSNQNVAEAHGRGEQSRQCVSCSKQIQPNAATDADGITMCLPCFQKQANALDFAQEVHKGTLVDKARSKTAAARGGLGAPSGSGAPGPNSSGALHRSGATGGSSGGLDHKLPAAKKGQQPPPQLSGHKRSTSDAGHEEPPPKRDLGAARTKGRRSAPPALEDKEPIVLVDSSDDEGAARTDAAQHAKTGTKADPGSAAAAAGQATGDRCGSFLKLSAQLAGLKCCFPVDGGKDSVEVTAEDLARLENGEYLNDTCIDFYIKYIEAHLPKDVRSRYHFFNSFFLKKLQEKPSKVGKLPKAERVKQDHDRVKKWTKHVDLFSKDFIFVPIHGHLHWSLVLICHPGNVVQQDERLHPPAGIQGPGAGTPLLLHLDSLAGNHAPKTIFEALRSYLELEWKRKMDDETHESVPRRWKERFVTAGVQALDVRFTAQTLPGVSMSARLPKQNNHTDCGLFLLSYMDFFAAANPRCIVSEGNNAQDVHALDPCPKAADTGTLLQKGWFHRCNAARLRDHLRALICRLMLDCVSQDDQRRSTLVCVVNDYDNKPHKMGFRYLDPTSYLDYVREWPDEDDPITQEGVLSSGSDAEEQVGNPKNVLQSPSPLTTRAAAKKAGTRPDEALPMHTAACRKRDKAPQPTVDGVGSASEVNKCAVGLPSPDKVVDTSQVDVSASPAAQGSTEDEGEEEMPGQQWEWRRATGQQDTHGTCFTRKEATANDVSGSPVTPPSQQDPETLPVRRPPPGVEQSSKPHVSEPAVAGEAVGLSASHGHIPRPSAGKRSRKAKAAGAPGAKASSPIAADVTERAAKPGKAAAAAHENLQGQFQRGKVAGVGCHGTPDQAAERSGDRRGGVAGQCRPSTHGIQVASQLVPPPSDGQIPGSHRDPHWVCKGRMQQHVYDSPSSSDDQCMSTPQLGDSARAQSLQPVSKGLSNGHHAQAHVAFRVHTRFPDDDAEPRTELVPFSADKAGESPSHHNGAEQHTYPEYEEYSTGSSYGSGSHPKRRRCNSASAWLAHTEVTAVQTAVTDSMQRKVCMDKPFTAKAPAAVAAGSDARAEVDIAAVRTVLLRDTQVEMSVAADLTQEDGQLPYGLGKATSRSVSGEPQGQPEPHTDPESLTAKSRPIVSTSRFLAMLGAVEPVALIGAGGKRSAAVSSAPAGTAVRAGKHVAAFPNFRKAIKEREEHMDVEIRFNKGRLGPQNDSPASMQAKQQPILQGVQPADLGSPVDGGQGPRLKATGSHYCQSGHGHDQHRRQSTRAPSVAEMQQSSPMVLWHGPRASPQPSGHSGHAGGASRAQGDMKRGNKIRETKERLEQDLRQLNGGDYRHIAQHPILLRTFTAVPEGKGDAPRKPATELNTGGSASQFQGILGDREVRPSDGGLLPSTVGDGGPQGVGHRKQHRAGQGSTPEQHTMQDSSRSQRRTSWQPQPRAVGSALDGATAPALAASSDRVGDQPSLHESPSLRLELQDGGGSQDQAEQRRVSEEGLVITDDETVPRSSGGGGIAGAITEQDPVSRAPCCAQQVNDTTCTECSAAASPDLLTPAAACNSDVKALPDMFWKASIEGHIVGKCWLEIGASRQVPATEGMPNGTATAAMALAAVDPSGPGGLRDEPSANAGGDEDSPKLDADEATEILTHAQLDGRQLSDSGTVGRFQRMVSPLTAGTATRSQDGDQAAGIAHRSSNLRDCKGANCTRQQEVAGCKARRLGIPMGEGPSHAETATAVQKAPGSAARPVGNAAAAAPVREQDNAEPWMAAHRRAAAIPAAVSTGSLFGNGGESEVVIINDDESEDQLAEGTHEMERGGDGSTAAAPPQAQETGTRGVGPSRFGRGTENDAEELDGSTDEDSLDTGWARDADGRDESDEDSGEAFVKDRGPGTGQSRNATAMTPSARGKQAKQANKQKERGSHGSIGKGPGRGRGRKGGHNGGKPCSSTKGVTPSRGGNAGGSTCGRDGKQGRLCSLRRDAPAGGIDAYCMRQGAEMVRTKVKPEFPRSGQSFDVVARRAQHDPYDLTQEES